MTDHARTADMDDSSAVMHDGSLSLQEAAERLGVSERTIQRRIQKGMLHAYKADTPRGLVWRVILDGTPVTHDSKQNGAAVVHDSVPVTHDSTPPAAPNPELLKALDLAEQLRRDNAALVQRNEQLAGQLGFIQAKLQDAEEQIRLLMAPQDARPAVPTPQDAPTPGKRAWWRRLIGS